MGRERSRDERATYRLPTLVRRIAQYFFCLDRLSVGAARAVVVDDDDVRWAHRVFRALVEREQSVLRHVVLAVPAHHVRAQFATVFHDRCRDPLLSFEQVDPERLASMARRDKNLVILHVFSLLVR